MNSKKSFNYSIVTLLIFVLTRIILKVIGINNIPIHIYIALLVGALMIFIIGVVKSKSAGILKIYYIIFTLFLITIITIVILGMILNKYYPEMFAIYKEPIKIFGLICFVLFGVFVIGARNINKSRDN